MHNIWDYIDAARARHAIRSDRKLGQRLGLGPAIISQIRTGRSFLNDQNMMELATLAGMDQTVALVELNIWRTRGAAQHQYIELLKKLSTMDGKPEEEAA